MKKSNTIRRAVQSAALLRSSILLISVLLIVYGIFSHPAYGDIRGAVSGSEYQYIVTNLPDFDQVRKALNAGYGNYSKTGLPGDGKAYCVPTSTLNLLAYISHHGFPEVTPGIVSGPWQSSVNYNLIGLVLKNLGNRMNTDPSDGTTKNAWYFGIVGDPFFNGPPLCCQHISLLLQPILQKIPMFPGYPKLQNQPL